MKNAINEKERKIKKISFWTHFNAILLFIESSWKAEYIWDSGKLTQSVCSVWFDYSVSFQAFVVILEVWMRTGLLGITMESQQDSWAYFMDKKLKKMVTYAL